MELPIIFVGGLKNNIDENVLYTYFSTFGIIKKVNIAFDSTTNKRKDFAFIEFEDKNDVEEAIFNMNNSEIYGNVIKVSHARESVLVENSEIPAWKTEDYQKGKFNNMEVS